MESELGVVLNPLDGLDEPLQPLNMVVAGEEPDDVPDPAAKPDPKVKQLPRRTA
jgi:hypothetical protein